jgi:hypothetical protein
MLNECGLVKDHLTSRTKIVTTQWIRKYGEKTLRREDKKKTLMDYFPVLVKHGVNPLNCGQLNSLCASIRPCSVAHSKGEHKTRAEMSLDEVFRDRLQAASLASR